MEYRRFGNTIYARIDRGEEVLTQVKVLCETEKVHLGHITALGATDDFTVGVFDVETKKYHALDFHGPHEILSIIGTVTTKNGEHYSHLHMSAGNTQGNVVGGHLNRCIVSVTCELVLTVTDGAIERKMDESIGINLFSFE